MSNCGRPVACGRSPASDAGYRRSATGKTQLRVSRLAAVLVFRFAGCRQQIAGRRRRRPAAGDRPTAVLSSILPHFLRTLENCDLDRSQKDLESPFDRESGITSGRS
ncbi:MAG TPA: hypothetical protein VF042_01560, partial [Gemmatimonadaceae bacterium]